MINEFLVQKLAAWQNFGFITHFVLKLLKWGIFDTRGQCDITVEVKILKICQNHHRKCISRAKISCNAKFRLHKSLCSQVIEMWYF